MCCRTSRKADVAGAARSDLPVMMDGHEPGREPTAGPCRRMPQRSWCVWWTAWPCPGAGVMPWCFLSSGASAPQAGCGADARRRGVLPQGDGRVIASTLAARRGHHTAAAPDRRCAYPGPRRWPAVLASPASYTTAVTVADVVAFPLGLTMVDRSR